MQSLTLRKKLWIPLVLAWLGLLLLTVFHAFQTRDTQLSERRAALSSVVDMSMTLLQDYAQQAQAGKMSEEEAQAQAKARVGAQRYGKDGYITLIKADMTIVMHPINAKLNGKYMGEFKDAKGKPLYVEIARAGALPEGGGYIDYWWPRPGATDASPKLGYVGHFKPWNWDLVAGDYMDDIEAAFRASLYRSLALLLVLGVVISAVAALVVRSVLSTIGGEPGAAAAAALRIADGDLAVRVNVAPGDTSSLMFAIGHMREQLAGTVSGIHRAADSIASAAREISAGNTDLSSRTEQQASSLQETAASMEQLTTTVRQNADNARMATELAGNASKIAEQGGAVVSSVVETMHGISTSSNKITEITGVIDSIAFQTNILALNAAVEAARAGEQGRGFAVVAGEVRTLAQRSASAAREIKSLIDQSASQVESGASLVEQAGRTMADIVTAVSRVTQIMEGIDTASQEQRTGIEEVNRAVTQMDEVTQQNAALVEEATAAAASLEDQADSLYRAISVFRVAA